MSLVQAHAAAVQAWYIFDQGLTKKKSNQLLVNNLSNEPIFQDKLGGTMGVPSGAPADVKCDKD